MSDRLALATRSLELSSARLEKEEAAPMCPNDACSVVRSSRIASAALIHSLALVGLLGCVEGSSRVRIIDAGVAVDSAVELFPADESDAGAEVDAAIEPDAGEELGDPAPRLAARHFEARDYYDECPRFVTCTPDLELFENGTAWMIVTDIVNYGTYVETETHVEVTFEHPADVPSHIRFEILDEGLRLHGLDHDWTLVE